MIERADMWDVTCPFTDQTFRVQFWKRPGHYSKQGGAVAVWYNSPDHPNRWHLLGRSDWPGDRDREDACRIVELMIDSRPGGEAFADARLYQTDAFSPIVAPVEPHDEGYWLQPYRVLFVGGRKSGPSWDHGIRKIDELWSSAEAAKRYVAMYHEVEKPETMHAFRHVREL